MRGISRARSYPRKEQVWRERIDYDTGEVRGKYRSVTRRVDHLRGRSKGFLLFNDAPAVAAAIGRYLQQRRGDDPPVYGPLTARQARIVELRQRLGR